MHERLGLQPKTYSDFLINVSMILPQEHELPEKLCPQKKVVGFQYASPPSVEVKNAWCGAS
jgi:hypothetical protein